MTLSYFHMTHRNVLVSRTCPSAVWRPGLPKSVWNEAKVTYDAETGWTGLELLPGASLSKMSVAEGVHGEDGDGDERGDAMADTSGTRDNENEAECFNERLETLWRAQIHQNLVLTLQVRGDTRS